MQLSLSLSHLTTPITITITDSKSCVTVGCRHLTYVVRTVERTVLACTYCTVVVLRTRVGDVERRGRIGGRPKCANPSSAAAQPNTNTFLAVCFFEAAVQQLLWHLAGWLAHWRQVKATQPPSILSSYYVVLVDTDEPVSVWIQGYYPSTIAPTVPSYVHT